MQLMLKRMCPLVQKQATAVDGGVTNMIKNMTSSELIVTDTERKEVLDAFPILEKVTDKTLVEKAVRLWVRTRKMAGYEHVEDIPNEQKGSYSLCSHCRAVSNAAYNIAKAYAEVYQTVINYDYLIIGAVIHDIDKPICYGFDENGKLKLIEFGKIMPHGVYSAYAALEEKLPYEIAAIPFCHSAHASRVFSGTIEGIIVDCADKTIARTLNMKLTGTMPYKTGIGG